MKKLLTLLFATSLLAACSNSEQGNNEKLIKVDNIEVVKVENGGCSRFGCNNFVTFKKGDTSLRMSVSTNLVEAVTKGAVLDISYDPENLYVEKYMFSDFQESK
ncbi:hypothetical protein BAOM_2988 [Peribacillus asahii]|uniref:Lipoprotein n=1 Tax=Peribacillus asahii TaxID=228899 RepID=A0A3Q9RNG8_9BACI|nr:hypothetical protein [Peribacillus asahii]AZV43597.1 hypothetical protein BAOM_2988 [Peribacillus asahii]